MLGYIIRRILLMGPTIWGILTITFIIIQFVPGGPIDQLRDQLEGNVGATEASAGSTGGMDSKRRGLSKENYKKLEEVYHLDRPLFERYCRTFIWFSREKNPDEPLGKALLNGKNWDGMLLFKFGDSFYRNKNVLELIKEKLPVSVSLGVWSFFISYTGCIILGILKAIKDGTRFDTISSAIVLIGYSIPGFVLAVLLLVLFGPGDGAILHIIPLSGLTSAGVPGYEDWSMIRKIFDYLQHIIGPLICLSIGSFAVLTMLTKNSMIEETGKLYVTTARAKGLSEKQVLFKHILRNALIPLITGFPSRFLGMFFTGAMLIEKIFNLDGMGLLSYTSVMNRDFTIVMGSLFVMTLLSLVAQLITDLCYVLVDPRISFDGKKS